MKTIGIAHFKAHVLQILGEVATGREPILIARRGKPPVEVVPFADKNGTPGKLSAALVVEQDSVSPLGKDMWDACG